MPRMPNSTDTISTSGQCCKLLPLAGAAPLSFVAACAAVDSASFFPPVLLSAVSLLGALAALLEATSSVVDSDAVAVASVLCRSSTMARTDDKTRTSAMTTTTTMQLIVVARRKMTTSADVTIHVRLPGYQAAVDVLVPAHATPLDAMQQIAQDYHVINIQAYSLGNNSNNNNNNNNNVNDTSE